MQRTLKAMAGIVVTAGAGLALTAAPAMAHDTSWTIECPTNAGSHVTSRCGTGGIKTNHRMVVACDERADNLGVRTHYELRDGRTGTVGDGNGSAGPCGADFVTTSSNPVAYYMVCAGYNGADSYCSPRIQA
jgi:hypothetical protein